MNTQNDRHYEEDEAQLRTTKQSPGPFAGGPILKTTLICHSEGAQRTRNPSGVLQEIASSIQVSIPNWRAGKLLVTGIPLSLGFAKRNARNDKQAIGAIPC